MSRTLPQLIRRDLQKTLTLRTVLIWVTLSALGVFFFFTTSGKRTLMQKNEVDFMALFLPQLIFGAWAVLSIYFDLISSDRQHNVLDCILTAGVSKGMVFFAKIISLVLVSFLLSLLYLLPVSVVIAALSISLTYCAPILKYVLPLWGYILVYASLGFAISIAARSTKTALILSLASGLVLMPRFFTLIVDGIGALFQWTPVTKDLITRIAPGVMLEALAHNSGTNQYLQTVIIFVSSILALLLVAFQIFCSQDELNYGE